jgi:hypothetical protein
MTLNVVGAIQPSLREAEIERVKGKQPENMDAYDLVLRSLPYVSVAMSAEAAKAMPFLERGLTLEGGYATAHGICIRRRSGARDRLGGAGAADQPIRPAELFLLP